MELKRSLTNRNTPIAVIIGILCMIVGTEMNLLNSNFHTDAFYLFSFSYAHGTSSILLIIVPILVCLPFSTSYLQEKQSNFQQNIYVRINKRKYLITKVIINGLVGGLTITIILTISFLIFLIFKGTHSTVDLVNYLDLSGTPAYLYGISPFLYVLVIIIGSFFGGFTFSTITLSLSTIIKNKYISLLSPFILNAITGIFLQQINKVFYMANFFDVTYYSLNLIYIVLYEAIILSTFIGIFFYNGLKEE